MGSWPNFAPLWRMMRATTVPITTTTVAISATPQVSIPTPDCVSSRPPATLTTLWRPKKHMSPAGHAWDRSTRRQFGDDALNLVASRDCVNRSKGSRDPAEWSGVRSGTCGGVALTTEGRCFWAARTVAVKYRYDLAVDTAERAALRTSLTQLSRQH